MDSLARDVLGVTAVDVSWVLVGFRDGEEMREVPRWQSESVGVGRRLNE